MLPILKGRMNTVIADSSFNAAELSDARIGAATVVPLLLDVPDEFPADGRAANRSSWSAELLRTSGSRM